LDGTVAFEARELPAGAYQFAVRYTDSNQRWADADYTVTVVDKPLVTGQTSARIAVGGTAEFELAVTSGAGIKSALVSGAPAGADVSADTSGRVVFKAGGLAAGAHRFSVTYTDGIGQQTEPVEFTVTVQAPPSGAGRNVDLADDREIGRLAPADDVTGANLQALTAASFTSPEHGSLELEGAALKYTPEAGWQGVAPFQVTVCDDLDQCLTLDYSFTVLAVWVAPAAPQASGATAVIPAGGTADLAGVASADQAAAVSIVKAEVATSEAWMSQAVITPAFDGRVQFDAAGLAPGSYPFEVRYTDSAGQSAIAEFAVNIQAPPTAESGSQTVGVGQEAVFEPRPAADQSFGGSLADSTVTGSPEMAARVSVTGAGAKTRVAISTAGLDAAADPYQFAVQFADDLGQVVDAVFAVSVVDAPLAVGGGTVKLPLGGAGRWELTVTAAAPIQAAWAEGAPAGSSVTVGLDGAVAIEAGAAAAGTHEFWAVFEDSVGQTGRVALTVVIQAPPLVASGREVPVASGGTTTFEESVTTAGEIASREITSPPAAGRAELGSVIYHAEDAPAGRYPFEVTYTDDLGQTAVASYTAVVLARPASAEIRLSLASDQDHAVVDPVAAAAAPGAGTLAIGQISPPAHGLVAPDGAAGLLRYTPEPGFAGEVEFAVTVRDEVGQEATITYLIDIAPAAPENGEDEDQAEGEDEPEGEQPDGGETGDNGSDNESDSGDDESGPAGPLALTGPAGHVALGLGALALIAAGLWLLAVARRRGGQRPNAA
ncbi:MAG: hypothetical protein LBD51_07530, partial [Bifidobacteriaceae bacterium]|jgi:hypothetical protein|nr:hypothetical protein [Bifidobacteriaceae bacterium]